MIIPPQTVVWDASLSPVTEVELDQRAWGSHRTAPQGLLTNSVS